VTHYQLGEHNYENDDKRWYGYKHYPSTKPDRENNCRHAKCDESLDRFKKVIPHK
jgi:hypothetical protein